MEFMLYSSERELKLEDIAACVANADYYSSINHSEYGSELIIHYRESIAGKMVPTYCRWHKSDNGIASLEPEMQEMFRLKNSELKSLFVIGFFFNTQIGFSKLLKTILNCYHGYVVLESTFYDVENIGDIKHIKLNRE
jgi:hypothetical protein